MKKILSKTDKNFNDFVYFPGVFSKSSFVGIVVFNNENNEVLLLKESDKLKWRNPGGGVSEKRDGDIDKAVNETDFLMILKKAAKRELQEEVGILAREEDFNLIHIQQVEDSEDKDRIHLKVFFLYRISGKMILSLKNKLTLANSKASEILQKEEGDETEKIEEYRWIPVNEGKIILNDIRVSAAHFQALLKAVKKFHL